MISNAPGVAGTGMFKTTCENILTFFVRTSLLYSLTRDLITNNFRFKGDEQGNGSSIMQRVSLKLNGFDPILNDETEVTEELSIEEQTRRLISIASDHTRYITHYDGWCPYW